MAMDGRAARSAVLPYELLSSYPQLFMFARQKFASLRRNSERLRP